MDRNIWRTLRGGIIALIACVIGTLTEAAVNYTLIATHARTIPADDQGMVAVVVTIAIAMSVVMSAMGD